MLLLELATEQAAVVAVMIVAELLKTSNEVGKVIDHIAHVILDDPQSASF